MLKFWLKGKNQKYLLFSFIFLGITIGESYAMKLLYYDISFSTKHKEEYSLLPNGITELDRQDFALYVRPANKIYVADGQQLWLWGSKHDNPNLFFSEVYYPEGSSLSKKPNYFYIEIMFYAKKSNYAFYPKRVTLVQGETKHKAVKYIVLDGDLDWVGSYGNGDLLTPVKMGEKWFGINKELDSMESIEERSFGLPLKKRIGFAVRFDVQPPSPGEFFTIEVEGLKNMNNLSDLPSFQYDSKKVYTFGAN